MDNDEKVMKKIMEMLVEMKARAAADRKAFIEWMNAKTKTSQAETKAILAETKARREKRMEANTNDDRNESTACEDVMEARVEYVEPASGDIKVEQNETTACNEEAEKIEENPEIMKSAEEHQDVSSEDVVVGPVKGLKKRRRGRKSTAGRRGEPEKLNRGNCGSRKKLAAACRKVSRHATVAWRKRKLFRKSETRGFCGSREGVTVVDGRTSGHATVAWLKRNLFRRSGTQEFCGERKELTAAGIRKIPCAHVVRRKRRSHEGQSVEQGTRNNWTRNQFARRTRKGRTVGRGQTMSREGTNASRNRGFKEQLRFGNVRKTRWLYRTTIGMKMLKQVVGTSSGLRRIRQWTLWMDRPPPKWKTKSCK
jgi:hypothetical protein